MSYNHKNKTRSKKNRKSGCGCYKPLRFWGGKHKKSIRIRMRKHRHSKKRKTIRGGDGFTIEPTYPFSGVSFENTIPLSGGIGSSCDPTTPANVFDARQNNL